MSQIRVIVVDDHEVVREGLFSLISRETDMTVVGSFRSAEDAIAALDERAPDVITLDHRLPGLSGAAAIGHIKRARPSTAIVMLTTYATEEVLSACLVAGARGYLLKCAPPNDIIRAIRAAASGDLVLSRDVQDRVISLVEYGSKELRRLDPIELLTLSLVAQGKSNREVARNLGVSEGSVKTYLRGARVKLGATDRAEAVATGIRRGII